MTLAVAGVLMLAGCGGGSKSASMTGPRTPTPTPGSGTIPLLSGQALEAGTIPAGESRTVGEANGMETVVRCSADGENCIITVAADGTVTLIAGSLRVEIGGITITVAPRTPTPTPPPTPTPTLPPSNLPGTTSISPGESRTVGEADGIRTVATCPPDGSVCVFTVAKDGSLSFTGGTPTFTTVPLTIPGGGTAGTTWEQLPTLIDRMETHHQLRSDDFPGPSCDDDTMGCQAIIKSMVESATEPTGAMQRFQGTRTVQTDGGVSVTGNYWGGWLENSIFIAERLPRLVPLDGHTHWHRLISMGIRNRDPVAGVYRGDAVDREGNWGSSELNYTGGDAGGQLDLTINIQPHRAMRWSNIPVDNEGHFFTEVRYADNVVGPNMLLGLFYQGDEVGGVFSYRWSLAIGDDVSGAFGAKRTP